MYSTYITLQAIKQFLKPNSENKDGDMSAPIIATRKLTATLVVPKKN